jgi:UV DNA damage endonuclease
MHYSVSREDVLTLHPNTRRPDLQALLESGHKKAKLRAHSNFYWNPVVNEWALSFWDQFDIMCESKGKNLASFSLHKQALDLGLI